MPFLGVFSRVGGTKVCPRHLGHMMATTPIYGNMMATTPIYGKNPSEIFPRTSGLISTKLVCSIGDSCSLKFVQMMTLERP